MNAGRLIREARKAAQRGAFDVAEAAYRRLREMPQFRDDVDISLRLAWCAERTGDYTEALAAYEAVLREYREQDDEGAARVVEGLIEQIRMHLEDAGGESEEDPSLAQALDDAEVLRRLMKAGRKRYLADGETLCEQGEPSRQVWLLLEGRIEVRVPGWQDTDLLTGRRDAPYILGELGYFTGQRRAATLVARSYVELLEIDVRDIHAMCARSSRLAMGVERMFRERLVERVLSRHAIFERINDVDRRKLALVFECREMGPGEVLIEAGQEHDAAWLVQSGCLILTPADDGAEGSGITEPVGVLPGEMVHVGGLLQGYVPRYRVTTATPVRLLRLSRDCFAPFTLRRPWIIQAILRQGRKPPHQQVMRPDEDYLWHVRRRIVLEGVDGRP